MPYIGIVISENFIKFRDIFDFIGFHEEVDLYLVIHIVHIYWTVTEIKHYQV